MTTRWMAALAAAIVLAGCSAKPAAEPVVADAWVRLPAVPGRPAAAYATITGGSVAGAVLRGVSSPAARRGELHLSMTGGGQRMTMRPVAALPVPAGGTLRLAPGGAHVMLFDLSGDPRPGGTIALTFDLDRSPQTVQARLVAAGDPAP